MKEIRLILDHNQSMNFWRIYFFPRLGDRLIGISRL
jgi:hypothetical protein